jgi:hypothetical protein
VTPSKPSTDTLLTSQEAAFIREALCTCSDMLAWIARNGGPQAAALAAGFGRTARNAAYDASLAVDYLDFPRKQAR